MFKVIIAGGRDFNNYRLLTRKVDYFLSEKYKTGEEIQVVCGGARGADDLGRDYAEDRDIDVALFPADWNKHGKSAGYIRNQQMGDYADALIAFWDGESRGTKNMIDIMNKLGKLVRVVNY